MKKEERIRRYGKAAYEKVLQQARNRGMQHREERIIKSKAWREANPDKAKAYTQAWYAANSEKAKASTQAWRTANPEKVIALNQEQNHKGGKRYEYKQNYMKIGLQGERNKIRGEHQRQYQAIKQATPNSVLHDEWIPGAANYRGLALVKKVPHEHGIIEVLKVLEGEITLFTEKEIAAQVIK